MPTTTTASTRTPTSTPTSAQPTADAAEDKVWQALRQHPCATAAELALAGRVGGSTARRILAAMEKEGSAVRERGATPRAGDRWRAAEEPGATTPPAVPDAAVHQADGEQNSDREQPGAELNLAVPESADTAGEYPTPPATPTTVHTEASALPSPGVTSGPDPVSEPKQRLRPGALHGLVEDFLIEHPGAEFTAGEIGRKLDRSSGAVANALVKLAGRGVAKQTTTAPTRYTHATEQPPVSGPGDIGAGR